MRLFFIMLIIAATGIAGGTVSANISKGIVHWGWSIIAPLVMCIIWMELMRSENQKLLLVTALSDVVYNGTWFLGMMLMGIPTTWTQKFGIILLMIGVYLVG